VNPAKSKRFREGLEQLLQEGVVQSFSFPNAAQRVPLLGAVGPLQFDVVQARLENEYGAEAKIETAPWQIVRWLRRKDGAPVKGNLTLPTGAAAALDEQNRPVALFTDSWPLRFFPERNPELEMSQLPFDIVTDDQSARDRNP
jgi:peptide chain release factor 3